MLKSWGLGVAHVQRFVLCCYGLLAVALAPSPGLTTPPSWGLLKHVRSQAGKESFPEAVEDCSPGGAGAVYLSL